MLLLPLSLLLFLLLLLPLLLFLPLPLLLFLPLLLLLLLLLLLPLLLFLPLLLPLPLLLFLLFLLSFPKGICFCFCLCFPVALSRFHPATTGSVTARTRVCPTQWLHAMRCFCSRFVYGIGRMLNISAPNASCEKICVNSIAVLSPEGLNVFSGTTIVSPG